MSHLHARVRSVKAKLLEARRQERTLPAMGRFLAELAQCGNVLQAAVRGVVNEEDGTCWHQEAVHHFGCSVLERRRPANGTSRAR
jgi:hypothetical protein